MELGWNLESDDIFPVSMRVREGGVWHTRASSACERLRNSSVLLNMDHPERDTCQGYVSFDTWSNPLLPRGTNVSHQTVDLFWRSERFTVMITGDRFLTTDQIIWHRFRWQTTFYGAFYDDQQHFSAPIPTADQFFRWLFWPPTIFSIFFSTQSGFPTVDSCFPVAYGGFPAKNKKE